MARLNSFVVSSTARPRGMNSAINPLLLEDGFVVEAFNVDIIDDIYVTRKGYQKAFGTPWETRRIRQAVEYEDGSGTNFDIFFGVRDGFGASDGVVGYGSGGTVFPLVAGLDTTARPYFIQIGKQLLFVNGDDAPFLLDGLASKQFGITAPVSLSAASSAAAGFKVAAQRYVVAITYYNSVTKAESSPVLAIVQLAGGQTSIDMTFPAANPATADRIVIYSTVANGSVLLFENEILGTNTSYNAGLADTSLTGPVLELDNSRVEQFSSEINYPALVTNRLFLKTGLNEIRNSKIGQSGPMYESFEASAFVNTDSKYGNSDDITAIGSAGDIVIVGKQRSIGRLDPIGIPNTLVSTDTVRYVYTEISDSVPVVGHGGGQQVFGEYVFLSKSNIYATDGRQLRPVADAIKNIIESAGFSTNQSARVSSINDETNRRLLIAIYPTITAADPNWVLVGDYSNYPNFAWTIYNPGIVPSTHPALKVGCFYAKKTNTGGFRYFFGSSNAVGEVFELYKGITDDGSPIYFRIKSKIYGDGATDKLYKTCNLQASGRGNDYTLQVCGYFDLSSKPEECQNISLETEQNTWDNAIWDEDVWSDASQELFDYDPHRKARYIQLSFTNDGLGETVSLFGWDITGSGIRVF